MTGATIPAATTRLSRRTRATVTALTRLRRIGYAVLGLQLAAFLAWSTVLFQRYALTFDYAVIHQAWWQIAHGTLDPSTLEGFPYWRDHGDLMVWPLTALYWVTPNGVGLLWLQDVCVVAAEAMAFTWMCDAAARRPAGTGLAWIPATGLVLLVANPWIWWAVSFDIHIEPIALLLTMLVIRDLAGQRRRAWIWVIPLLACGDVAGTYLVGAGLGGLLAVRKSRRTALLMVAAGLAGVAFLALVHANRGSGGGFKDYAYLAQAAPGAVPLGLGALVRGIAAHPMEVLRTLWSKRTDVLANLAPGGLIGVADLSLLPLVLIVVCANTLFTALRYAEPIFQYLPVYVVLPAGTVFVLLRLRQRSRVIALALCGLLAAQAVAWAAIWAPDLRTQWLRVSPGAAATLNRVATAIPASASVVASEGIIGRFSSRARLITLNHPGPIPVHGLTWFVLAPSQGNEILDPASAVALIQELAGLGATLVAHADGVWAFRWLPPPGTTQISVSHGRTALSAWAASLAPGTDGHPVLSGPGPTWHVASNGRPGYVADELAWRVPAGHYEATVRLSASGPVNVEVWDDNAGRLLSRRSIPATDGIQAITLPVGATTNYPAVLYRGWGPFKANFSAAPPGQELEVRVWSPGGETVDVYGADLANAGAG